MGLTANLTANTLGGAVSTHPISVRTPTGAIEEAELIVSTESQGYSMRCTLNGLGNVTSEAGDVFECLTRIRHQLDPLGYRLLVNGASRHVWASGMARDMGGGWRAYRLTTGKQAQIEDLVEVLAPAPESDVASVEDQEAFMRSWVDSISESRRGQS
jgi:hypothetical protein